MAGKTDIGGIPSEAQLEKINKLSRRPLSGEEVYVFPVVLCDNEIDRDNERFSIEALETLAKLYVGKTGIFDHSMHGRDQCARIFDCEVECDQTAVTQAGEAYHRLKAYAYMPRTEANRDLMLEIDAGIKKEVSVGCATAGRICSVCGTDLRHERCGHIAGRVYRKNGKPVKCHAILSEPTDAYEWSFVAVPAQPKAGVVKAFVSGKEKTDIDSVIKALESETGCSEVADQLRSLKKRAEEGAIYRDELCMTAKRLALLSQPALDEKTVDELISVMDATRLKEYTAACEKAACASLPIKPQLTVTAPKSERKSDTSYII